MIDFSGMNWGVLADHMRTAIKACRETWAYSSFVGRIGDKEEAERQIIATPAFRQLVCLTDNRSNPSTPSQ